MFGDSPRELYALLEEKCTALGAKLILWAVALGAAAAGILFVLTLVAKINRNIVTPFTEWVKRTPVSAVPEPSVVSVGISLALTILLLGLAIYLTIRWIRGWQRLLVKALDSYLKGLRRRVEHLEANAADVQSTNESVTAVMQRVNALEPHRDVRLRAPAGDAAIQGLRHAMLVRALQEDAGIRNVGIVPEDEERNLHRGQ